jgi:hypothetical protein
MKSALFFLIIALGHVWTGRAGAGWHNRAAAALEHAEQGSSPIKR